MKQHPGVHRVRNVSEYMMEALEQWGEASWTEKGHTHVDWKIGDKVVLNDAKFKLDRGKTRLIRVDRYLVKNGPVWVVRSTFTVEKIVEKR